ncbi:MAG: SRPBCC family protein [Candidatus Humimicrobiaceae bacterium]
MKDDKSEIIIKRTFNVPREQLWKAWTKPEIVKKWWGPEGFYAPSIKIDLKVGGKNIFGMHGPKGSEFDKDMYSAGVYNEIVPMEKIAISDYFSDENGNKINPSIAGMDSNFPDELNMVIRFEDLEKDKTELIITYPRPDEAQFEAIEKSGMVEGWNSSLDKLAKVLESNQD